MRQGRAGDEEHSVEVRTKEQDSQQGRMVRRELSRLQDG